MGKAGISVGVCILWAVGGVRSAESDANGPLLAKPVKAPPLETLKLEKATELPAFHDAIYCPDADAVVLLRGRQLIRLSPKPPYEQAVTEDDRFAGAKLIGAFRSGQRFWVALHGAKLPEREGAWPVVYEVGLRRPVVPVPEGLKERGAGATEMTICAAAPRRGGLLVFTCGRQEDGWPRDGHRPVYFWLDIAHGGDMRRIQPGWDLDYLADGGRVAVFEGTYLGDFRRRPLIAMDMEDGEFLRQTPDRDKEDLAGLPPKASEEPVVRQTVGEWQAVTVDLRGTYNKHLWMRGAKDLPGKLRPVGRNIVVSALLGDGRCVFAVRGPPSPDGWAPGHTAFVYDCARDGAWDRISVADTGTGMSAEETEKLFRIEVRRATQGTDGERGNGIGLILCRELVALNRGKIEVVSEPGSGSTFTVVLPAAEQPRA